jgi:hypothetical protein
MSVSMEAVDSDLIQDGIDEVLEAVLVEVDVVVTVVVPVVVVVVVVLVVAAGGGALTEMISLNVRFCAACTTDVGAAAGVLDTGVLDTSVFDTFDPRKEISTDPISSIVSSACKEWLVCDLNDMR